MVYTIVGLVFIWMHGINNGIKQPTCRYQNCNTSQILIFGGYVKVRESSYTRVIIWVNTIPDHIDTRMFCLGMKTLAWYIDPNGIENKYTVKYPYPTGIKKCEILIIDTRMV